MVMKSLVALVGTKHRGREAMDCLAALPNGEPLILIREPDNAFDSRAVQVWARGVHIGFLKKEQNAEVSARLDATIAKAELPPKAVSMPAKLAIDGSKWPLVEVES
jgi:hypothetical protein